MSTTDIINVSATNANGAEGSSVPPVDKSAHHESVVAEIVGMIRAKYQDEGDRNFAIGKRAFEHAAWQRFNFSGYTGADFDNLMNRLRDDVRIHVAISPKAIKVGEWARCHLLRSLATEAIGKDLAELLSFFEYRTIYGEALSFSKKDVEGTLVDGWLDFIRDVANVRTAGGRVTTEEFFERFAAHKKFLADAKATSDPAAAAAKAASDAIKAKTRAVAKANEDITSSVSDALANGHISAEGVLGILENVAKHHGVPLPSAIGFDPARCTMEDCDLLASTMFQAGKYAEMVHLRDRLDKMVSAVDKARAAAQRPAVAKIA